MTPAGERFNGQSDNASLVSIEGLIEEYWVQTSHEWAVDTSLGLEECEVQLLLLVVGTKAAVMAMAAI